MANSVYAPLMPQLPLLLSLGIAAVMIGVMIHLEPAAVWSNVSYWIPVTGGTSIFLIIRLFPHAPPPLASLMIWVLLICISSLAYHSIPVVFWCLGSAFCLLFVRQERRHAAKQVVQRWHDFLRRVRYVCWIPTCSFLMLNSRCMLDCSHPHSDGIRYRTASVTHRGWLRILLGVVSTTAVACCCCHDVVRGRHMSCLHW